MRIGREAPRSWHEGEVCLFDDSFEHEVWNDTEEPRLVLIVDLWHPALSSDSARLRTLDPPRAELYGRLVRSGCCTESVAELEAQRRMRHAPGPVAEAAISLHACMHARALCSVDGELRRALCGWIDASVEDAHVRAWRTTFADTGSPIAFARLATTDGEGDDGAPVAVAIPVAVPVAVPVAAPSPLVTDGSPSASGSCFGIVSVPSDDQSLSRPAGMGGGSRLQKSTGMERQRTIRLWQVLCRSLGVVAAPS